MVQLKLVIYGLSVIILLSIYPEIITHGFDG